MNSRERVQAALAHREADRVPVDFLAVPEIWRTLTESLGLAPAALDASHFFDPTWEAILRALHVDCRVVSYDQFCAPPSSAFSPGDEVEWWDVQSRSTPARMWRRRSRDGSVAHDILGRQFVTKATPSGAYEENVPVLATASSVEDLQRHPWPDPSWFDFSPITEVIRDMNAAGPRHVRYRIGSVFEVAWQLRGLEQFMLDMALEPGIPRYMMERLTDLYVENLRQVLSQAGEDIDMVYFYDDLASNAGLLVSLEMWEEFIRPHHARLIEVARKFGKKVMYHSDGALHSLVGPLIDLGVDVLNPIQPNVVDMEPERLKRDFGDRLSFHGGIDIIGVLPHGTPAEVRATARSVIEALSVRGGYVLASSHHIQSDTPIENVRALYDLAVREWPSSGVA
jgi:uroporphyrinogen decarboxylase